MENEKLQKLGELMYDSICTMFSDNDILYEKDDENLTVVTELTGEDLPMRLTTKVYPDKQNVTIVSTMPFRIPPEKRAELTAAIAVANYGMLYGGFELDWEKCRIRYRLSMSYVDSMLGKGLFYKMTFVSLNTIDDYNDKFFMISQGNLSLKKFTEEEMSKNS